MQKKRKLSASGLSAIIVAATVILLSLALLIFNAFIPIKYASAYFQKAEERDYGSRVTFFDVGYGDCAIVDLPDGKVMLIDSGENLYKQTLGIMEELAVRGVEQIDYLVCTSVKKEHCGAFAELIGFKTVKTAFVPYCTNDRINDSYYKFINALRGCGAEIKYASAGDGIVSEDGSYFLTFLSPANYQSTASLYGIMNSEPTEMNIDNASAVVYLECDGVRFVFTSDVRDEVLDDIVTEYKLCKRLDMPFRMIGEKQAYLEYCDFVTVPAHGNERGASAEWYKLINARNGVVSVGKNYASCPSPIAVAQLNYRTTYYTSFSGNITVIIDGGQYSVVKEKQ